MENTKPRKLTKRVVEALKPGEWAWCTELRGFGARCRASKERPKGRRYYVVKFRAQRRQRWITIGEHAPDLTVEKARKRATQLLSAVRVEGADPAAARDADKLALTVAELCDAYLEAAEKGLIHGKRRLPKKASTLATDRGRIERHIKPLLGKLRVKDLSSVDVQAFHDDVATNKTSADIKTRKHGRAIVKGGRGAAARTVGLLGGILTYADRRGIISSNPARGIYRGADARRDVRLTPADYRALGKALDASKAETPQLLTGIRLLALTGARRGEIEKLRWSEIDETNKCFRLLDTKEGKSVRPIGTPVLAVLNGGAQASDFVLPAARGKGHFKGLPKGWTRVMERANLPHVTPHTLRHSFASVANELGYTEPTIAAMLGHASASVTSRYIHHIDAALAAAADRVAKNIQAYMVGETAEVVTMQRKPA